MLKFKLLLRTLVLSSSGILGQQVISSVDFKNHGSYDPINQKILRTDGENFIIMYNDEAGNSVIYKYNKNLEILFEFEFEDTDYFSKMIYSKDTDKILIFQNEKVKRKKIYHNRLIVINNKTGEQEFNDYIKKDCDQFLSPIFSKNSEFFLFFYEPENKYKENSKIEIFKVSDYTNPHSISFLLQKREESRLVQLTDQGKLIFAKSSAKKDKMIFKWE